MHPLCSSAVVYWLDVFTRNKYKNIVLDSLSFCQKEKDMEQRKKVILNKKYYKCGLRPVIIVIHQEYNNFLAMNWETGVFEEDFRYSDQIFSDPSGDVQEMSKEKFDTYVEELRNKKK